MGYIDTLFQAGGTPSTSPSLTTSGLPDSTPGIVEDAPPATLPALQTPASQSVAGSGANSILSKLKAVDKKTWIIVGVAALALYLALKK